MSQFNANVSLDYMCKGYEGPFGFDDPTLFHQVVTLYYDIGAKVNFTIDQNFTIRMNFSELILNYTSYDEDTSYVGPIVEGPIVDYVWTIILE